MHDKGKGAGAAPAFSAASERDVDDQSKVMREVLEVNPEIRTRDELVRELTIGRLLNTFLLVQRGVLRKPLLYLSYYFKLHRTEYYDRLMAVRLKGDWEGWLRFFLRGVVQTAREASATAGSIFELREAHRG